MKLVLKIIRAVAILAFLILSQIMTQQMQFEAQKTFQMMPYMLALPLTAILFGALLRIDVLFTKNKVLKVDWLSLLLVGAPCLLAAYFIPVLISFFPNAPMPQFVSTLWGEQIRLFGGVAFGYTVMNSLFEVENKSAQ